MRRRLRGARGEQARRPRRQRPCSPASRSWPATKPPVQGSPVSASRSGDERRDVLPAAVGAGDVRELVVLWTQAAGAARARQLRHGRPRASGRRAGDPHPLACALRPRRSARARARPGCGRGRTGGTPRRPRRPARSASRRRPAPSGGASSAARRASATPRGCRCRRSGGAPSRRERRPSTTSSSAIQKVTGARRRTRSSPTRRVSPSASKRSSRSCAVAAADAEQVAEARERDLPGGLALGDERRPGLLVGGRADGEPVADAHEPPRLLERARELRVVDLHRVRPGGGELGEQLLAAFRPARPRPGR